MKSVLVMTMMSLCMHMVLLMPLKAMQTRLRAHSLPPSRCRQGYLFSQSSSYSHSLCCQGDSTATTGTWMGDSSTGDLLDRSIKSFCEYEQIPEWLLDTLHRLGLTAPTPVQQRSLPAIFDGKDVIMQSQTGSGKTLAYCLPIVARIDATRSAIQAVIIVPTRELGLQVTAVLKQLSHGAPEKIMIMSVVEGSKNRRQLLWATAEPPHILVGNPRAVQRLVDIGRLRLNAVSYIVIDEVDACLIDTDTRQELHTLLSRHLSSSYQSSSEDGDSEHSGRGLRESRVFKDLGKEQLSGVDGRYRLQRQTIMCSATIPQRQHFASTCFQKGWTCSMPDLINVSLDELAPAAVEHQNIVCAMELRMACLAYVLRSELGTKSTAPSDSSSSSFQCIVFLDAKQVLLIDQYRAVVQRVVDDCSPVEASSAVQVLVDSMDLDHRGRSLDCFRSGESAVLICSDMAARGLDVPNTALVVQMSLPSRMEEYLHRAGRTGRLGRGGKVVTFTSEEEQFVVERFSNELGVPIRQRLLRPKQ